MDWNYDKSEFESVSQVAVDDEKIKVFNLETTTRSKTFC